MLEDVEHGDDALVVERAGQPRLANEPADHLGVLAAGAASSGRASRVVMVSSENHRWPTSLEWDALPTPPERYTELRAYGQAKLCCVLYAIALDARVASRGIRAHALHPGDLVSTGIDKDSTFLRITMALARPFAPTASQAAATSCFVATSPAARRSRRALLLRRAREGARARRARSRDPGPPLGSHAALDDDRHP